MVTWQLYTFKSEQWIKHITESILETQFPKETLFFFGF